MLGAVLDIVQEHIPNLEALNLDSNKMYNIEKLGLLASKFQNLKILHIGDNKVCNNIFIIFLMLIMFYKTYINIFC